MAILIIAFTLVVSGLLPVRVEASDSLTVVHLEYIRRIYPNSKLKSKKSKPIYPNSKPIYPNSKLKSKKSKPIYPNSEPNSKPIYPNSKTI